MTDIKICGIMTTEALEAAVQAGANFIGFVFCPDSPRFVTIKKARSLGIKTPTTIKKVGLFVDPELSAIETVLEAAGLDMIQLHGNETPQQVQDIKNAFGLPVIKAIRIAGCADLKQIISYEKVCDWLLFDTKSSKGQGGTGESFDWSLLKDITMTKPWMLAGGLNRDNIGAALSILQPYAVDVSSGVENDEPGLKNPDKIKEFIEKVKKYGAPRA